MYIDSSNFYFHSKKLLNSKTLKYNWAKLIQKIIEKCMDGEYYDFEKANYYAGLPDPRVDNGAYHKQRNFLKAIDTVGYIKVKTGYILKNKMTGNHSEKGIDVMLATDISIDASENEYDTAILVSGDGDFRYCIDKVKQFGKEVVVCVPEGTHCEALKQLTSKVVYMTKSDLKPFVKYNI